MHKVNSHISPRFVASVSAFAAENWCAMRVKSLRRILGLALSLWTALAVSQDWTVNLRETDIQELIQFVAEATDTTIVVDPKVKGQVKVVSNRPVTNDELYDLFLSILDVHGYTAVRSGNVVRVIPSKDARSSSVRVQDGELDPTDEYITQVIHLENISATKLLPVLRPLAPQQAHMAVYAPANAMIISDVAANIERIRKIIDRMDQQAVQETDIISLKFASADDVVRLLNELNKVEAQQSGAVQPEVLVVADQRSNSVLVNGDELERGRMRSLIRHLDTPLEQSGNVKVIYLEYASAVDIARVLSKVMQNLDKLRADASGKQVGGSTATIEADEGTNSLVITAEAAEMKSLEAVIQRLDIRRAQVLVEAIITELDLIDGQDLGIQWLFRNNNGSFGSNISGRSDRGAGLAGAILPDDADGNGDSFEDFDRSDLLASLAGTPGTTLGWGQLDESLDIVVVLDALRSQTNANILSTPSLLTLDNQEAYITVGQQVPFVTGSYTGTGGTTTPDSPFQTIQRENVGITLTVTPHVNEGDSVVLDIQQEVSSLTGLNALASDIITNERKIQTRVLAADRRTLVLGGLIKDDLQDVQRKVPLLGDIPWLGRLFRSDSVTVTRNNLLIFIKPTIIRDEAAMDGATARKYRYIQAQQQRQRDAGVSFLGPEEIPVLPEWEEQIQQLEQLQQTTDPAP